MRRILLALICFFFIISEPVCVYAHPGRTDGSGGHYNRSTGEYHYHHGYREHQHSDMDGDGDLDCPYDFEDKTRYYDTPKVTIDPRLIEEIEEWHQKIQDYTYPDEYTKINEAKDIDQEKSNDNDQQVTLKAAMSSDAGNSSTEKNYFDFTLLPTGVIIVALSFMMLSQFLIIIDKKIAETVAILAFRMLLWSFPFFLISMLLNMIFL